MALCRRVDLYFITASKVVKEPCGISPTAALDTKVYDAPKFVTNLVVLWKIYYHDSSLAISDDIKAACGLSEEFYIAIANSLIRQ